MGIAADAAPPALARAGFEAADGEGKTILVCVKVAAKQAPHFLHIFTADNLLEKGRKILVGMLAGRFSYYKG